MAGGIHAHPVAGHGHHPLDEGITGRFLQAGKAAHQGQIHQEAAQGPGFVILLQGGVKGMGGVEHHDFAPSRSPLQITEFFY